MTSITDLPYTTIRWELSGLQARVQDYQNKNIEVDLSSWAMELQSGDERARRDSEEIDRENKDGNNEAIDYLVD
jgi:hypothetical protein